MLTAKDLEKYHQAAERILNAMDNSPVPISWHEMDRMALQSVIAKELILIDKRTCMSLVHSMWQILKQKALLTSRTAGFSRRKATQG